jgi:hypothetical protein
MEVQFAIAIMLALLIYTVQRDVERAPVVFTLPYIEVCWKQHLKLIWHVKSKL